MKALVTGGAGFIGSNLSIELVNKGHDVVVLDDMYLGTTDNLAPVLNDITLVNGDVRDRKTVEQCCDEVDVVFHNAARSSAPMHKDKPVEGADVNVLGFINVMEQARNGDVDRVVYASTSSMYGSVEPPHREHMGEYPVNLYSASKMSRELYAKVYSEAYGIPTAGLRYFSVYGPREKAKGRFANLVSQFLWTMMDGEQPLIYGDGTQTRDFTFVKDIVRGNLLAAESRAKGEVFNLGTGTETSLNTLIEILNETLDTEIEPRYKENPLPNYVMRTRADCTHAENVLGYSPNYTLKQGIAKTVGFYREDADE